MGKHQFQGKGESQDPYADYPVRDPLDDLVLSQLVDPATAVNLSRAERVVILAAVRSEVLINPQIRKHLKAKVADVVRELLSARRRFPQA
jgi:hypothetical protein